MEGGHITRWCSAPGCMMNVKIAKRHFFRFPREKDRWLEWIKACNRMDLMMLGPECTNRYYRLCHLHFQVEMLRNFEGRVYLSKEAVPSIFFKPIQPGSKPLDSSQLVSFVTIFLKPEKKNRNSAASVPSLTESSTESQRVPTKLDERGTPIVSPLQAVIFPKSSVKNTSLAQTTPSEVKMECDNANISGDASTSFNQDCTYTSTSTTLMRISAAENCNNERECVDLTTDSLVSTTSSKTVLAHATTQVNDDSTAKKRSWHVLTQTPNTWLAPDSVSEESLAEECKICTESPTAKRRRKLCADHQINVNQLKATCAKLLPRDSTLLISACINARERRKARKGRFENRQFALKLFLMAPRAYQFYRPLCQLPSMHRLQKHICDWDVQPGLNDNVMNALRLKLKLVPATKRRCCLFANEVRLRPHLFYNLSRDRIVGFYNIGTEKRCSLARKALVLTARSLAGNWEQPVAYYLLNGAYHAGVVRNLIFQAIITLRSIGANVHVLVTSTAPIFLRLSQQLQVSAKRPSFTVNDESVFYIFDVARLIRTTRNVFKRHELCFHNQKKASWMDIERFFRRDCQTRLPLVPELSLAHFEVQKCRKVNTERAAQLLSTSVAAGLSAYIASGEMPLKTIGTMEFASYFGRLYNILNSCGSTKTTDREFEQAFTGSAREMCFLKSALDFLHSIRVIDATGECVKPIKCFERWQITINAVIQLWGALKEHLPSLRTRRLNQEDIERVFCSLGQRTDRRGRLTPVLFTRAFKTLISEHLLDECSDEDDLTTNARKMLRRIASSRLSSSSSSSCPRINELSTAASRVALNVESTSYRDINLLLYDGNTFKCLCEFLLSECLRVHVDCNVCIAYAKEAVDSSGTLASNTFGTFISDLEDVFMRNFEEFSAEEGVGAQMLRLARQIEYQPPCPGFPVDLLSKLFLRMRIYFTLLRHNKICRAVKPRDIINVVQL